MAISFKQPESIVLSVNRSRCHHLILIDNLMSLSPRVLYISKKAFRNAPGHNSKGFLFLVGLVNI